MTIRIDRECCEGNAVCVALAPELFDLDEDAGIAIVLTGDGKLDETMRTQAERAASCCPREAITVEP